MADSMDLAVDGKTPGGSIRYEKIVWPVFAVFLVFILARYMQWGVRKEFLGAIRIDFLTGGAVIALSLMQMTAIRGVTTTSRNVFIAIFALLAIIAIQVPFAANRPLATDVFVDRVFKFAMLAFLIAVQVRSPAAMRWFIGAFLLSMFWITQESVRGLISGGLVWQNQGIMRLHGAVPMYAHPNSLGGVSASVIPFCVFLFIGVRNWWVRLAMIALIATATICVIYSGSRTAYVGYLSFVMGWFLISRNKKRWITLAIVVAAAGLAVLPQEYKERFLSIGGEEAEGASKEARIQIIEDAVQIFLQNPGGIGVASFPTVRQQVFGRIQDTHNLYLEVATNLGIQGLILFLVFVGVVARSIWRARSRIDRTLSALRSLEGRFPATPLRAAIERERVDAEFLKACATATFFFLNIRLVVGMFGMDLYEIYWWFAAGMAISLNEVTEVLMRRQAALLTRVTAAQESRTSERF